MQATMFADDACFSFGHACRRSLESLVNSELTKISKWFWSNKLTLNVDKTCFLLIHRRREEINLQLKLNGVSLVQKDNIKYLGVTIDQKLNWKSHINNCTAKLSKCLWAISRLRRYTNTSTLRLVYYALGYSYIQYGISLYGGACKSSLHPLLVKQKLIVKIILNEEYTAPSSPLFYKLNLLKFNEVYTFQISKLMFNQIRKGIITSKSLSSLPSVHSYATRSSSNLNYHIPIVKSNLGKTAFSFQGPIVWNSLPLKVKTATIFQFKFMLKKHLLSKYIENLPALQH